MLPTKRASRKRKRSVVVIPDSSDREVDDIDDTLEDDGEVEEFTSSASFKGKAEMRKPQIQPPLNLSSKVSRTPPEYSQWVDKHAPTTVKEVCINPQKLKQVRDILKSMIDGTSSTRLLVISGPSGSSKSTTIKLLADELVQTRRSVPAISSVMNDTDGHNWIEFSDSLGVEGLARPDQLKDFLDSAKFMGGQNMKVVLIEELPNVFHEETLRNFRDSIRDWISSGPGLPPLVLCLTEVEYNSGDGNQRLSYTIDNNLTVETLLLKELVSHPAAVRLKFNPLANRFIGKTLRQIVRAEEQSLLHLPSKTIDDFLAHAAKTGDVRCAIQNLQLWASQHKIIASNRNEAASDALIDVEKLLSVSHVRENAVDLFHAIGKIIYSSSEFANSPEEEADYMSVQKVLTLFKSSNMDLLTLSLLENYHIYRESQYSVEMAAAIAEDLSMSDMLAPSDALGELALRLVRLNLRKAGPSTSSSGKSRNGTKFPRHYKMIGKFNRSAREIQEYRKWLALGPISFDEVNMLDGYYVPQILNTRSPKRYLYNRIGGSFVEIDATEDLPIAEPESLQLSAHEKNQFHFDIENKIQAVRDQEAASEDCFLSDPVESDSGYSDSDGFLSDLELNILISQGKV